MIEKDVGREFSLNESFGAASDNDAECSDLFGHLVKNQRLCLSLVICHEGGREVADLGVVRAVDGGDLAKAVEGLAIGNGALDGVV